MALFSIIIPHRDDVVGLTRTLLALSRQRLPSSLRLEVIVVDNGMPAVNPSLPTLIRQTGGSQLRLLHEPAPGASRARNAGFAASSGERIAFLDCDCTPNEDWVQQTMIALDCGDVAGGPVVVSIPTGLMPETTAEALDLLFGFNSHLSFKRDGLLLTANIAMHRHVFSRVGPFRDLLSEDRDWCMRAAALGYRLALEDSMSVTHRAIRSEARLRARWIRVTRETYHFNRTYGRSQLHWLTYLVQVALSPFAHVPRLFADPRTSACSLRLKAKAAVELFKLRWLRVKTGVHIAWRG